MLEQFEQPVSGHLTSGIGDFGVLVCQVEDVIEAVIHFIEPKALFPPVLEPALVPAAEVGFREGDTVLAVFGDDGGVGDAVAEHDVELVAEVVGKASDFGAGRHREFMIYDLRVES